MKHPLDIITDAIELDTATIYDAPQPSRARMTFEWAKVMQQILKLPVPKYEEPRPVSGEIVSAAQLEGEEEMYGNGYGNEDYIDRMNRAKKVDNERDPFIGEGQHVLALLELFEYMHDEKGPTAKARFVVLESKTHAVGSTVCKLWFLTKPGKFKDSITDSDRFADFVLKLKGVDPATNPGFQVGAEIRKLIRFEVANQPERGRILFATGRNVAKAGKDPFIDVSWRPLQQQQDPGALAQKRAELDAQEPMAYSRQLNKILRDLQSMGQMPPAPHAATQYAPQGGYQQSQGQWSPPPGAQPTQYAPPQGQWQQQPPQGPPPGQYQQGGPVQGPPPGVPYGQPMQSPVPQGQPQQPAPQGPPQGGFLSQLPPQGGNNGQGGGWR